MATPISTARAGTRVPNLRIVPAQGSEDTIACLQMLLGRARRGEVIGLAYCAMLTRRSYIVDTAGIARDSPTFARGMVRALDDTIALTINRPGGK